MRAAVRVTDEIFDGPSGMLCIHCLVLAVQPSELLSDVSNF